MSLDTMDKKELLKSARSLDQQLKLANERIAELEATVTVAQQSQDEVVLPLSGVGRYLNKDGKPTVVTLKFNPATMQASVESVEVYREDHRAAYQAAKMLEETFRSQKEE